MSRFATIGTTTVDLGPCQCPDTPHDRDSAEVYDVLGWDDLVDVRDRNRSAGSRALALVTHAVASWTLLERNGTGTYPVPVTEANVHRLDDPTSDLLWPACWAAFQAAEAPLPNASGAPSRPSRPASASRTRKTTTPAKPTS